MGVSELKNEHKLTKREVYRETMHWLKVGAETIGDGMTPEQIRDMIHYYTEVLKQQELIDHCIRMGEANLHVRVGVQDDALAESDIRLCEYCGKNRLTGRQLKYCSKQCKGRASDQRHREREKAKKHKKESDRIVLGPPVDDINIGSSNDPIRIYTNPANIMEDIIARKGPLPQERIAHILRRFYPNVKDSTIEAYAYTYQRYLRRKGLFADLKKKSPDIADTIKGKWERWSIPNPEDIDYIILVEGSQHRCRWCGYLNRQHRYRIKNGHMKCENCGRVHKTEKRK